ncbi:unnamed protein product, partial [Candidula unifasciata]
IGSVFSALSAAVFDRGARDDDTVDRVNHMVMYGLLVFLGVASGTRQYVGSAIYCWSPAEFTEKIHRRYIHHYCLGQQNVQLALFLFLAVLFRVPQLLWKQLNKASDANMQLIVGMTTDTVFMDQNTRDEQLRRVAEYFHRWITTGTPSSRFLHCYYFTVLRAFCCNVYLYTSTLYFRFFIISAFLKTNFWKFGFHAMTSYIRSGQWEDEYNFPRVTHCDVKIRQLENVHTYTVQCVLAINLFLEKMFLLLWFCLMLMLFVNAISFVKWLFLLANESRSILFLWKFFGSFLSSRHTTFDDRRKCLVMLRRYLKADGLFVIQMVSVNTTDMLTIDLVRQIWLRYKTSCEEGSMMISRDGIKLNGHSVSNLNDSDDE